MADNRAPKLSFLDNVPVKMRFLYDTPITGTAKSGANAGEPYWLYKVEAGGEKNFFATEALHNLIQEARCKKGTDAEIGKYQQPDNTKKVYWSVKTAQGEFRSDKSTYKAPAPAKADGNGKDNPIMETPSINDLVFTYSAIFGKVVMQFDKVMRGLRERLGKDFVEPPPEIYTEKMFAATYSIFSEAMKNHSVIHEGDAKALVGEKKPLDDLPKEYDSTVGDVCGGDSDIPF
ncbi:MAG: hypothetical protein PHX83_11930 [Acidobacteriia bacterium]|nr:hypothetical protein [Terriglobia bacterium]